MTNCSSLLAKKLRSFRTHSGAHGRMTQEQLADLLGVSVDAISKYERSVSFMRGDLEHRLVEKLGWTRDEVIACRQDWETRAHASGPAYRVFREFNVASELGSVEEADLAVQALEREGAHDFPDGFSASAPIWRDILRAGAMSGVYVTSNGVLGAHLSLVFLNDTLEARFRERCLVESEFTLDALRSPLLPGDYFGYCAGVYIAQGHQKAALSLLSGFVGVLEDLAEQEVFLRDLTAIAASPIGHQLCNDLNFRFIGPHVDGSGLEFWHFAGEEMQDSLFARRSPALQQAYSNHFAIG